MSIEQLRADLVRLREEIGRAEAGDRDALAGLEQLSRDVERELEQERGLSDPAGLVQEFERSISGFEASHPNLSAVVNNLLVLLGSIGV
ncbi:MAG: DUF4404 family protein [Pseudomonadales bacterium]|nr:DUF4404 family protein [Pseudomonadales bacterium]